MGSTFSNNDGYITIAYGNDKEALAEFCEKKGYRPSEKLFDSGYIIVKNE